MLGNPIIHGSCPTSTDSGSKNIGIIIAAAVVAALVCAVGFLYCRRSRKQRSEGGKHDPLQVPQNPSQDDKQTALEMGSLAKASVGIACAKTQAEKDALLAAWRRGNAAPEVANAHTTTSESKQEVGLAVDFNDIVLDDANIIGDGGSCVVYKTSVYGMSCAVKVLHINAGEWEEQQFDAEVKLLSSVHHANLCRFYACSTNGPQKCLLLELMDHSLDRRLVAQPALGWEQRVWIVLCICRGLVHLHSLVPPIIHRDIKSQNILTTGFSSSTLDEANDLAKVADFGIYHAPYTTMHALIHRTGNRHACTHTPYVQPQVLCVPTTYELYRPPKGRCELMARPTPRLRTGSARGRTCRRSMQAGGTLARKQ
jgi:hypothetical protein